jgi:thiosulfate sulfurtransferase
MRFEQMEVQEVRALLETGTATIVDIRDPATYEAEHIEGALNISEENLPDFLERADREAALVVYCYHGISSQQAAAFFSGECGFKKVYNLIGGFEAWGTSHPERPIR